MSIVDSVEDGLTSAGRTAKTVVSIPRWVLKGVSILLFVSLWWTLVDVGFMGFDLLRTPRETTVALWGFLLGESMGQGGSVYLHAFETLYRVAIGLGLALVTAIPLGLACGWSDWWRSYVYPAFEFLRPIPPVAWVPIALIAFASEFLGIVWVVFVGAFFPMMINTMEGVAQIEPEYVRAVESLGGGKRDLYRHVVVPHTLPSMITGTIIGVGVAWIAVVAAEMLSGGPGLGYVTFQAYRLMDTGVVIVGIIILGVLGAGSSAIVMRVGSYLTPWSEDVGE
jgi:NitT/TauT family transport system permease protein